MNYLLDTHIWLWSLLEPDRLSPRVTRELENPDNPLWLSPISSWETLVLAQRGRIVLDKEPGLWVAQALKATPIREAALTHQVAIESRNIQLAHKDPADRFIAATALVYGLTLITADRRLLEAPGLSVLPNR